MPENNQAAHYLVDHVFSKIEIPAIVAGLNHNALINKLRDIVMLKSGLI